MNEPNNNFTDNLDIFKDIVRDREFKWDWKYFHNLNKTTFNFAEKLVQEKIIKDVYIDENKKIVIEHKFVCKNDLSNISNAIKNLNNREISTFKIPYTLEITGKTKCQQASQYDCEFFGCPLILAGYIYHNKINLKNEIRYTGMVDQEVLKEIKKEEIVLTEDLINKHKNIIDEIKNNYYISENVKKEFYKIIKTLNNYNEIRNDINIKPNLNLAITEDTDTINNICKGQERCIQQYVNILKYFKMIKDENSIKFINFKQLTEKDFLEEDNYKEDIIILHNTYILTNKIITEINNERQLKISMIKENFPSFILNNLNNKIFIICDKKTNVKNFYNTYNQLKVLFSNIHIAELTAMDIYDIFMKKIEESTLGLKLDDNFEKDFEIYLNNNYMYSSYKNMEFIEFIYQEAISHSLTTNHPKTISKDDLYIFKNIKNEDYLSLDKLIGLDNVKLEIKNLEAFLTFKNEKELKGDKMPQIDLHMCFLGNPGTGKTTVARLMAGILFNMGYIRYNKCLECEAKDFIANIAGETAMKTAEKVQEALGGILFIDEAYALGESEYGKECIATLIKSMEDFRDDLVVILAGYNNEMMTFLEINSGFKSRIAYYFDFKDYSNEELLQMMESILADYGFEIDNYKTRERINTLCTIAKKSTTFGNGRFIRNTIDKVLRQHAINTIDSDDIQLKNHIITEKDIKLY